jgi:cyclomaltodextrinase / maltogenic alpha-amylase / neopullulanase
MKHAGVHWDTLLWGYVKSFQVVLPPQTPGTILRYRLSASSAGGREVFADEGRYYALFIDNDPLPSWAQDAVVYQIFVDRFFPGRNKKWLSPENPSGFYGGTLLGIIEKLDYLVELGIDVIWLGPIFPSPSHHGYDASDYFSIEPRLGTIIDFRRLVDEAHRRNIRILLDFVPNHWSHLHPTFQDAISNPNSPYRSWYSFSEWPDKYETFFGVAELPKLNLRFPEARQHMLDAAAYWLDLGIDGYRVDHAIGPSPDFWADFRRVTRAAKPDCWTFGEVVDPPDLQLSFAGLLDGCLDFILLEALRQTFAFGRWSAERFAGFLDRHEAYFPPAYSRPSFLDNHDMNRFLWAAQGDQRKLMLAALCQFSLSGPPVIYQGTEVGLSQVRDVRQGTLGIPEESRLPMLWDDEQDQLLLAFYKRLIALRREKAFLYRSGSRRTIFVDDTLLVFSRVLDNEQALTVINLSSDPRSYPLGGQPTQLRVAAGNCSMVETSEGLLLNLPPLSGVILC